MVASSRRLALVLSSGLLAVSGAAAAAETPHAAGLTNTEARIAFGEAMFTCLSSRMGRQMIAEMPADQRTNFQPATAEDRKWTGKRLAPDVPVWVSTKLGSLLNIAEPSRDRCEVNAMQLPVDATFQPVLYAMQKAFPDFRLMPIQPGYNPIAYQLERVDHAERYILRMEGAEPGAPGHAFRFSLLYGTVTRQAVGDRAAPR